MMVIMFVMATMMEFLIIVVVRECKNDSKDDCDGGDDESGDNDMLNDVE